MRRVGMQHLGHSRNGSGSLGGLRGLVAGDQHMDVATDLLCGGHGVESGLANRLVVVFRDDESTHSTFASLRSFSTSALMSATLTPALRLPGSITLTVVRRGAT